MRIATLQFAPRLGEVEKNIHKANILIKDIESSQLDLLVLPELAFTGYNFPSLEAIKPFLEPTTSGTTTQWAISTAKRLNTHIIVGYPEIHTDDTTGRRTNYNSTVTVGPTGAILNNYRKSFLYYTDETWASEGFSSNSTQVGSASNEKTRPFFTGPIGQLGMIGHGICMDINPYRFTAPWTAYEFAHAMLATAGRVGLVSFVVLSMAWLTRLLPADLEVEPGLPDMETVAYWVERFYPFLERSLEHDVVVVFANRCGVEGNRVGEVERGDGDVLEEGDRVCYAGSSCIMKFEQGQVRMFEKASHEVAVLGKGEEALLVVDTSRPARFVLQQKVV